MIKGNLFLDSNGKVFCIDDIRLKPPQKYRSVALAPGISVYRASSTYVNTGSV